MANRKEVSLDSLNARNPNTMVGHLGIEYIAIGENWLEGKMPVDQRTHQPLGLLHGGANVALAETLGSMAANLVLDMDKQYAVGLDINANHLRAVRSGYVFGRAEAVHIGKSTQVWQIHIRDEAGKLVCTSRLTMAVLNK